MVTRQPMSCLGVKGAMVTRQPMSCLGVKGWYGHTTANELSWDEGGYGHTTANEFSCTVQIFNDVLTLSNQITKLLIDFTSFMTMVHSRDVGSI